MKQPERLEIGVDYKIRDVGDDDWALIGHAWKCGYRESIRKENDKYSVNREISHRILSLQKRGAVFRVAHDVTDKNHIIGFSCTELPGVVHWVYVKAPYRRNGVARALIANLKPPAAATSWNYHVDVINKAHPGLLVRADCG